MRKAAVSTISLILCLSGCQSGGLFEVPERPVSLLPVSQVVNAVKCELAQTFATRPDLRSLVVEDEKKADVKGALQLKNVVVQSVSTSGGAQIPVLGIELGPSGSLSRSTSEGQTFDLEFSYDLEESNPIPAFCASLAQDVQVKGDPFIYMLDGIRSQQDLFGAGAPKVKLGSFAYTSAFAVEVEQVAGVNIKFIVFSLTPKAGRKVTDTQTLKIAFGLNLQAVIL